MKKVVFLLLFLVPITMTAQQLVYTPINPSFVGGNSFNASWLLTSAESQNKLQEENTNEQASELEQFTESLNRQLLSSLSRDLFENQFGASALTEGTFTFGSLVVDIVPTTTGLSINVLDTTSGEQTQIIIPN